MLGTTVEKNVIVEYIIYHQYIASGMNLTQPTDFEVLDSLSDGKRDVAANIAHRLEKDRAYLNTRLPHLNDYGLVEQIGPAEKAGLYEITEKVCSLLNIKICITPKKLILMRSLKLNKRNRDSERSTGYPLCFAPAKH